MIRRYSGEFFDNFADGAARSASVIVPLVLELLPGTKSVVDVGCGPGIWAHQFGASGVKEVIGIDGSYVDPKQLRIPLTNFVAKDLTRPLNLDRRFDLCVSLEVAEHLPGTRAAGFVEDLIKLAPVILFSAAIPGQGGLNHINEQWPEYWQKLFDGHGYRVSDCIRPRIWSDNRLEFWYRQNILLFADEEHYPLISREPAAGILSIVHPALFSARPIPTRRSLAKEFIYINKVSIQGRVNRLSRKLVARRRP